MVEGDRKTQENFPIRGHHLLNYLDFRRPIALQREKVSEGFLKDPNYANNYARYSVTVLQFQRLQENKRLYVKDMIGEGKADADAFQERLRQVFERFEDLADMDAVDIVVRSDAICKICRFGQHCNEERNRVSDQEFMESFMDRARELHLEHTINEGFEEVFENGSSQILRKFTTTGETLRRVLDHEAVWLSQAGWHRQGFERKLHS